MRTNYIDSKSIVDTLMRLRYFAVVIHRFRFVKLIFQGSEEEGGRIVMTRDPDIVDVVEQPYPDDARLVDGNTTLDGQLQLKYRGRWRGVCTNFVK